ncbi:hypothetical protein SK128_010883 [Halocaridina rubra]|uniref:C2H2-type domain-containing protein n=1 Tax=Halocaridina rubra TaxID=373956 RepID=A0AAN8WKT2_HALRR
MSPAGGTAIPPTIEFPSQRRERVDWHKLSSVDLHELASGCSIEMLQENLSHITFCDAEVEFDVNTGSGQRNLLKMFRLAQLIIQYLFLSQEYIETQLQESQEEMQRTAEKYEQVKSKLLQQVEEAKKMKESNKNMRETVKYVNSVALANGIFQPAKCPLCCKTFRGQDFLQSHLWRKHPNHAGSIVMPTAAIASHSGTVATNGNQSHLEVPSSAPEVSAPVQEHAKTNDVDSFRLLEIERKFERMNENFLRIMNEMEHQKQNLERENEKRQEEIKKAWEEKHDLERDYEAHINKLSEHISHLQNTSTGREPTSSLEYERLLEYIKKQDLEIIALKSHIENQPNDMGKEFDTDFADGISCELQNLKMQLHDQKKNQKRSLTQIQNSLRKEYEDTLEKEKRKLREMVRDMSQNEKAAHSQVYKPPPTPKVVAKKPPIPDKSTKSPVKSPDMYEDSVHTFSYSHESAPDSIYIKAKQLQSESGDSESETDTSKWNQSNMKIQHLQITSKEYEEKEECENPSDEEESEVSSKESNDPPGEDDTMSEDESSESLNLETLLQENPQLWVQMRNATAEVLGCKLSSLGLETSVKGIKPDVLTSSLSVLRKERRQYEDKHDNFIELRRKLANEVTAKLDDKIEKAESSSGIQSYEVAKWSKNNRKQSGVLSRVVHNVRSKVKEKSKAVSNSVSKTGVSVKSGVKGIFNPDPKTSDVDVISRPSSVSSKKNSKLDIQYNNSSSESESEHSSSAQVEVHNETSKSVSRNLFGGREPMRVASRVNLKKGNFFENKTYGQVDKENLSEWDSDPEYENIKKAEPPVRKDSLNVISETADHPNTSPVIDWDSEPKSMKLKKPTGEKVSTLTRTIELQLSDRKKQKFAGAVDVMSGLPGSSQASGLFLEHPESLKSTPSGSQQHIHSVSDSSNTIPTSLWGSAEAVNKASRRDPRPSTSKGVPKTGDSEDDLEISEIE